jgi:hypothetical protein
MKSAARQKPHPLHWRLFLEEARQTWAARGVDPSAARDFNELALFLQHYAGLSEARSKREVEALVVMFESKVQRSA